MTQAVATRTQCHQDGPSGRSSRAPALHVAGGNQKCVLLLLDTHLLAAVTDSLAQCDGGRPSCSRCQTLRTDCAYEAEEGESRWSALRRRNQRLETERAEVRELMTYMQTANDAEAHEIFNRTRGGGYDDITNILRQVREGELPPSPISPSVSNEQRLPPIRTILEISDAARAPPPVPSPLLPRFLPQDSTSSGYQSVSSYNRGSQSPPELQLLPSTSA